MLAAADIGQGRGADSSERQLLVNKILASLAQLVVANSVTEDCQMLASCGRCYVSALARPQCVRLLLQIQTQSLSKCPRYDSKGCCSISDVKANILAVS